MHMRSRGPHTHPQTSVCSIIAFSDATVTTFFFRPKSLAKSYLGNQMLWVTFLLGAATASRGSGSGGVTSEYVRPVRGSAMLSMGALDTHANKLCSTEPCSEQVHVALGAPGEMVVSFVSADASTESAVEYGLSSAALTVRARGTPASYSLQSYSPPLRAPPARAPL